jgi:preprotein translocase subunit YajC
MKYVALVSFFLSAQPLWAAAEGPAKGGGLMTFAPLIAILGIFYFLLIRPQQKQAKEHQRMVNELKRGDQILTQGGLYGTVQSVKGKVIEVKISEDTKVMLAKSYVARVVQGDPAVDAEVVPTGVTKG